MREPRNSNKSSLEGVIPLPLPQKLLHVEYTECEACGTRFRAPGRHAVCKQCGTIAAPRRPRRASA